VHGDAAKLRNRAAGLGSPANGLKSVDVITAPYPGFATDLQAQFMAAMAVADGISILTETIRRNAPNILRSVRSETGSTSLAPTNAPTRSPAASRNEYFTLTLPFFQYTHAESAPTGRSNAPSDVPTAACCFIP